MLDITTTSYGDYLPDAAIDHTSGGGHTMWLSVRRALQSGCDENPSTRNKVHHWTVVTCPQRHSDGEPAPVLRHEAAKGRESSDEKVAVWLTDPASGYTRGGCGDEGHRRGGTDEKSSKEEAKYRREKERREGESREEKVGVSLFRGRQSSCDAPSVDATDKRCERRDREKQRDRERETGCRGMKKEDDRVWP